MKRKLLLIMLSAGGILYSTIQILAPQSAFATRCCTFSADCGHGGTCDGGTANSCWNNITGKTACNY